MTTLTNALKLGMLPSPHFTGRIEELSKLQSVLEDQGLCVILGPLGVGKTELAKKYSQTNKQAYKLVYYFDLENIPTEEAFQKFLGNVNSLQTEDLKLIILDNVPSYKQVLYFQEKSPASNYHFIVCSRNYNSYTWPYACKLWLTHLSPQESLLFLQKFTKLTFPLKTNELHQLATFANHHPLSLLIYAAYCVANEARAETCIQDFQEDMRGSDFKRAIQDISTYDCSKLSLEDLTNPAPIPLGLDIPHFHNRLFKNVNHQDITFLVEDENRFNCK